MPARSLMLWQHRPLPQHLQDPGMKLHYCVRGRDFPANSHNRFFTLSRSCSM